MSRSADLHFTSPTYPMPCGAQRYEDWPELDRGLVDRFNRWYDPTVQAEIERRARAHLSISFSDEIYFPHMRAGAMMELVRYARRHRGHPVSISMFGYEGGMQLL